MKAKEEINNELTDEELENIVGGNNYPIDPDFDPT